LRKGGLEEVAARVTELGVDRITPIVTARAVVRWDDERARAAVTRLRGIVREAAMQSRRSRVPEVDALASLQEIVSTPGLLLADRAGSRPDELERPGAAGWTVVSGPEGGLEAGELALLSHVPRLAVGPHVLRAETAPVAAVATLVGRASAVP
jgi:16S rRNA (uracil1498-N3)-methyltransferase